MFTPLKINVAALICMAFIFRILFVNVGVFSTNDKSKTNKVVAKHFSTIQKKRKRSEEVSIKTISSEYITAEACEERSGSEEDFKKAASPILLLFLFSLFSKGMPLSQLSRPFDLIKCHLYPKKYLTLSVLRI